MDLIKVLLVVEAPLIGNLFASVLGEEADIKVAGCVTTLKDALELVQTQEVHLILVSAGLPDQDALEMTRMIVARLVVEVGTVKNHVHSILEKLNVTNRETAASYLAFMKK
jgi:DNA-binding NarL/FixJ family response regulator